MREFFKGWRRKTGVATLAMALALVGVWCRSHVARDTFYLGIVCHVTMEFGGGQIRWERIGKNQVDIPTFRSHVIPVPTGPGNLWEARKFDPESWSADEASV